MPGVALSGLDIGRKNPLPHDQQGNRKPAEAAVVDAETGDVVESDQKGRGSAHSRARRATHRPSKKAHRSAARARKAN